MPGEWFDGMGRLSAEGEFVPILANVSNKLFLRMIRAILFPSGIKRLYIIVSRETLGLGSAEEKMWITLYLLIN